MKNVQAIILNAASNASQNGSQIDASELVSASFQSLFTAGDEAGTIKIQASNDIITGSPGTVTNWTDIPNAAASVSSGSAALIVISQVTARYIRAIYTRSGGGASNKVVKVQMFGLCL